MSKKFSQGTTLSKKFGELAFFTLKIFIYTLDPDPEPGKNTWIRIHIPDENSYFLKKHTQKRVQIIRHF